jgi:hypothetical protein
MNFFNYFWIYFNVKNFKQYLLFRRFYFKYFRDSGDDGIPFCLIDIFISIYETLNYINGYRAIK